MKFVIDGTEVPAAELLVIPASEIPQLKKQTGLGLRQLTVALEEWQRLGYDDDGEAVVLPEGDPRIAPFQAIYDSEKHWQALLAWVWISRRHAGADVTFAESSAFTLESFSMTVDDEAEEADESEDPTSPPASDPQEPGDVEPPDA